MDWSGYKTIYGLIGMGVVGNEKFRNEDKVIPLSHIYSLI